MTYRKTLILLAMISLTSLLVIKGQKTKESEPDITKFPTIEYQNRKQALTDKQQKRRKKYNNRHAPAITESIDQITLTSDWDLRLPALPVTKSSAVIIGEVTGAQAHLSEDETRVYSEFVIKVDEVLKNDERVPLSGSIVVERSGGRVRFPSGKVVLSATSHQDMPQIGKRYLLFLVHEFVGDEDLTILTGYELRDGLVFPLDRPGDGHPIWSYKGASESYLLNDLISALANLSQ